MCSNCEAYGLKKHGLTRSDCIDLFSLTPEIGVLAMLAKIGHSVMLYSIMYH